jgi:hypothetical protein
MSMPSSTPADTSSSSSSSLGPEGCCRPDSKTECSYDPKTPGSFSCSQSGMSPLSWNCCSGHIVYVCGECTNNPTACFFGHGKDVECSVWWQTSTTC